jgi:hypothetical protein
MAVYDSVQDLVKNVETPLVRLQQTVSSVPICESSPEA